MLSSSSRPRRASARVRPCLHPPPSHHPARGNSQWLASLPELTSALLALAACRTRCPWPILSGAVGSGIATLRRHMRPLSASAMILVRSSFRADGWHCALWRHLSPISSFVGIRSLRQHASPTRPLSHSQTGFCRKEHGVPLPGLSSPVSASETHRQSTSHRVRRSGLSPARLRRSRSIRASGSLEMIRRSWRRYSFLLLLSPVRNTCALACGWPN